MDLQPSGGGGRDRPTPPPLGTGLAREVKVQSREGRVGLHVCCNIDKTDACNTCMISTLRCYRSERPSKLSGNCS